MTVHISVRPIVLLAVLAAFVAGVLPAAAQGKKESADARLQRFVAQKS